VTPPPTTKDFIPTNPQIAAQGKVFIPNKEQAKTQEKVIEPSSLVDHMSMPMQSQFTNPPQGIRNVPAGGGSLNVQSAAFQRPTSNPSTVPLGQIQPEQKQINIQAKEFMPSMPSRPAQPDHQMQPKVMVHQRQF